MNKTSDFDVGISPHGLSVDLPVQQQETLKAFSLSHSAKPVFPFGTAAQQPAQELHRFDLSEVYTSPAVLKARRTLEAAAEGKPQQLHKFELTEREFLHAYFAVEHDRNAIRKAIKKGLSCFDDLKATDGLWRKLQAVMFDRLKGAQA